MIFKGLNMYKLKRIDFFILIAVFFTFSCVSDDSVSDDLSDFDQIADDTETSDNSEKEDTVSVPDDDKSEGDGVISDDDKEIEDEDKIHDEDEVSDSDDSSNLNTGDTSGNQAVAGEPGASCSDASDCKDWSGSDSQSAICLTPEEGYPGGYCSFMCDSSVSMNYGCNGFGGVYYGYGTWGDGYCFHPCNDPSDCRKGYRCSKTVGACMSDCAANECDKGSCDETEKVCLDK